MQTIFGKMKASKKIINKILQPEKTGINKIMIKEILSGVAIGLSLGFASFVAGYAYTQGQKFELPKKEKEDIKDTDGKSSFTGLYATGLRGRR